jgi:nitric oxide reductase subunit C
MNLRLVGILVLLALGALQTVAVYHSKGADSVTMDEGAIRGMRLFREKNCVACHQFYGLGGYMGPDLTDVVALRGRPYAMAFIPNGTLKMPDLGLSEEEAEAVVDYLEAVGRTGHYPDSMNRPLWNGSTTGMSISN